jgi:hypothetical protein
MNFNFYNRIIANLFSTIYIRDFKVVMVIVLEREQQIIKEIHKKTNDRNIDNISRTVFYLEYYKQHKEIRWAHLASLVSRNAGWNMTDLLTTPYQILLSKRQRDILFLTYERANWLIFKDAYPQLLIYSYSVYLKKPLFHLLKHFNVSKFMEEEWKYFWKYKNIDRLVVSLIINEQHVIQKPVIEHPFYRKKVFSSFTFKVQQLFHFSHVVFPTLEGELYGFSVTQFTDVNERIKLGKKLYWLLYQSKEAKKIWAFSIGVPHTGTRADYSEWLSYRIHTTLPLRAVYSIVQHHQRTSKDWYCSANNLDDLYKIEKQRHYCLTKWSERKQIELVLLAKLHHKLTRNS